MIDVTAITEKYPIMKQRRCTYGSVGTKSSISSGKINFSNSVVQPIKMSFKTVKFMACTLTEPETR